MTERLHLGCGPIAPPGWTNVDGSWSVELARRPRLRAVVAKLRLAPRALVDGAAAYDPGIRRLDVRRPLPFASGSIDAVYASHLLEHLHRDEGARLLAECHRVLRPGGALRVVVPDLRAIVAAYAGTGPEVDTPLASDLAEPADRCSMHVFNRDRGPRGSLAYRLYTALTDLHAHKWMYDARSLAAAFRAAGFAEVEQRRYLESRIEGIEAVELEQRVTRGRGLCVEGVASGTR